MTACKYTQMADRANDAAAVLLEEVEDVCTSVAKDGRYHVTLGPWNNEEQEIVRQWAYREGVAMITLVGEANRSAMPGCNFVILKWGEAAR